MAKPEQEKQGMDVNGADEKSADKSSSDKNSAQAQQVKDDADKLSAKTSKTKPKTPKVKAKNGIVAWLSFILASSACGGVGWSYWQFYQAQLQEKTIQKQLLDQQQAFQTKLSSEVAASLAENKQQWQQDSNAHSTRIDVLLTDLSSRYIDVDSETAFLDVSQLLSLASRKLWFESDKSLSLRLLQLAGKRAQSLNAQHNPRWLQLQQAIAYDIGQVESVSAPDTQALYLQLISLSPKLLELPLQQDRLAKAFPVKPEETLSEEISWDNVKKTVQRFIDDFVRVEDINVSDQALLAGEQKLNLRQNATSKLVQAQTALVNKQADVYYRALSDMKSLLIKYYDTEMPEVNLTIEQVSRLANKKFAQPLPKIEFRSLNILKQHQKATFIDTKPEAVGKTTAVKKNQAESKTETAKITTDTKPKDKLKQNDINTATSQIDVEAALGLKSADKPEVQSEEQLKALAEPEETKSNETAEPQIRIHPKTEETKSEVTEKPQIRIHPKPENGDNQEVM